MKRYDVIVIGAGHNGLTAAAYCAKAGKSVLVLERRPFVGGAAVSEERFAGFTYSSCSYVCSLFRPEIIRDLDLSRYGLQILPYEGAVTLAEDGRHLASRSDHHLTRREMQRHSRHDADAYDRFSADVQRQCRFIRPLLMQTPPDPASLHWENLIALGGLGRQLTELGEEGLYDLVRLWTMSCADYLDHYFESDLVKGSIAGSSIIGTALGPRSPGSAYVLLHHYMGDVDGTIGAWGFARGGMGSISKALADSARSFGAEIRCDAQVAEVIVRQGTAIGVALADGTELNGAAIVSGLDVKRTFLRLTPRTALDRDFVEAVEAFKIRGSSGKLNIALDGLPHFPALADEPMLTEGDIQIGGTIDYLERGYDDWKAGAWSRKPYLDIVMPTRLDPTMAPPGKHMMSVFVQYVPPVLADGPWDDTKRQAFGDTVLDTIERHAPGFRDLVLDCQIRSPWDLENEVGLTGGNIFHGELTFDQLLFNRPIPGYARYRAPLRHLYMCGSSTHPGGGVMGAPGHNAAREILKDFKRRVVS